jgi:hypothetical protein
MFASVSKPLHLNAEVSGLCVLVLRNGIDRSAIHIDLLPTFTWIRTLFHRPSGRITFFNASSSQVNALIFDTMRVADTYDE